MVSGRTLTRRSLTALIVLSIFVPVSFGLGLAWWMKRIPEPFLDARVRLDRIWLEPRGAKDPQRLVPAITVKNPTSEPWTHLSIGLNRQFYAQEPKGIPAGGTVTLPLQAFVARNGSVRFPSTNRDVTHVTVFAQIGTGARAVSEFSVPIEAQTIATTQRNDPDVDWIAPIAKAD